MKTSARSRSGRARRSRHLALDERGVYQTEYTVVLVLVALVVATSLALLAAPLVEYHDAVVRILDTPVM